MERGVATSRRHREAHRRRPNDTPRELRPVQPLADGRTVPVFVLTNSTASRRFLLTNPDAYSLTYNGLVMVAEKRRSNGWQAFAS